MTDSAAGGRASYPRLAARTRNFTLGIPGDFRIAPDGSRVAFLRAASGTDRTSELWVYDVARDCEHRIIDPVALLGEDGEELSPEERARRERARQAGAGVVAFTSDAAVSAAVFALSSRLWIVDLSSGIVREIPAAGAVIDPRIDPTGRRIAYVAGGSLHVVDVDGSNTQVLATSDGDGVTWGLAEFVAAEEMDRHHGYWWAPDGASLLVERADDSPIQTWHIADPANPERPPNAVRYPAAGTANADVTLWHLTVDGARSEIAWDRSGFEYLGRVDWSRSGAPLLRVLSRDQRSAQVLEVDLATGATGLVAEQHDDAWVDLLGGVPTRLPDGRVVTLADDGDVRRVAVAGVPVGPGDLDVRAVLGTGAAGVLVSASTEPAEQHVWLIGADGSASALTTEPGVHTAVAAETVTVVTSSTVSSSRAIARVRRDGRESGSIASMQEAMPALGDVTLRRLGADAFPSAVLFPRGHVAGSARLPVLLDPYGGPHGQRVVASARAYGTSQWLADQGFCVLVADGRGTPGRGPAWERRVRHDFLGTLDDQVAALEALIAAYPDDVDPARVGIRGWSYGGYLAALAVLRRPDVFRAAVAGAPVTDWTLYDTTYTERYLGHPDVEPEVYRRNGLIDHAPDLRRPLLLIHGLVDDNVVVAHTLRLSAALLSAGRPHAVLPLSGVTHMASQEDVAENLLRLQVDFLQTSLAAPAD
ncbi:MAG: prolyl oligopeptidase family serine peptidase [Mycobacteriales bacterium]